MSAKLVDNAIYLHCISMMKMSHSSKSELTNFSVLNYEKMIPNQ